MRKINNLDEKVKLILAASMLLLPGYIDAGEIGKIARFIASVDPTIPNFFHTLGVTCSSAKEAKYSR